MGIAFLSAKRCEDQDMNGACIVNNDNIIVGIGYNTLPEGCENMKSKKGIGTKMRLYIKYNIWKNNCVYV